MNTSLRRISTMLMALVVLLLLNATLTQVFTADGLRADPRNQRVLLDEYSRQRGQISAGGQLMAYSVSTSGRYRFLRVYPNPLVYAPITGFYSLRYSSTGLERAEDTILNGSDERLFGRRLADFFTGRDPRGGSVDTTIVPRVQQAGWDAMAQGCDGGPCKGAAVAIEPSTGKILALVSAPSYDPNHLASHDPDEQAAAWQALRDNPDAPLTNRAISERYPPGSTFKVITTAAALQSGIADDSQFTALPSIPLPDSTATLSNYGGAPCGSGQTASLRDAFARSCNTAFVQVGLKVGADALRRTAFASGWAIALRCYAWRAIGRSRIWLRRRVSACRRSVPSSAARIFRALKVSWRFRGHSTKNRRRSWGRLNFSVGRTSWSALLANSNTSRRSH